MLFVAISCVDLQLVLVLLDMKPGCHLGVWELTLLVPELNLMYGNWCSRFHDIWGLGLVFDLFCIDHFHLLFLQKSIAIPKLGLFFLPLSVMIFSANVCCLIY